jgi:hypothetical protein
VWRGGEQRGLGCPPHVCTCAEDAVQSGLRRGSRTPPLLWSTWEGICIALPPPPSSPAPAATCSHRPNCTSCNTVLVETTIWAAPPLVFEAGGSVLAGSLTVGWGRLHGAPLGGAQLLLDPTAQAFRPHRVEPLQRAVLW